MDYDDPQWKTLQGGYRTDYDPTPALRRLETQADPTETWDELCMRLHHQGAVGEASYAAVPALVDIQRRKRSLGYDFYMLIGYIEVERHRSENPPMPDWLAESYFESWRTVSSLAFEDLNATSDPFLIQAALGVVALAKRQTKLGALLIHLDKDQIEELLEDRLSWSSLYDDSRLARC